MHVSRNGWTTMGSPPERPHVHFGYDPARRARLLADDGQLDAVKDGPSSACLRVASWNPYHKTNGYDANFFGAYADDIRAHLREDDRILAQDGSVQLSFLYIGGPSGNTDNAGREIRYVYVKETLRNTAIRKLSDGDCWRRRAKQECISSDAQQRGGSRQETACRRSGGRVCHTLCRKDDSSGTRHLMSNGVPPMDFKFGNGDSMCTQEWGFQLPLQPTYRSRPRQLNLRGPIGVSLAGVPLATATDWPCCANAGRQVQCDGHAGYQKEWHYHAPNAGCAVPGPNDLVGYAMDGFPIYGPHRGKTKAEVDAVLDECNGRNGGLTDGGTPCVDGQACPNYRYHLRTPDQVDSNLPYSSRSCNNNCNDDDDIGPTNWRYVLGCFHGSTDGTVTDSSPVDISALGADGYSCTYQQYNDATGGVSLVDGGGGTAWPYSATYDGQADSKALADAKLPDPSTTSEAGAAAYCAGQCKALGYCCNDHRIGSNQYLSCSQACMIRNRGASYDGCNSACYSQRSCKITVGGYKYNRCGTCSDLTATCPHGVQDDKECYAGCRLLNAGQSPGAAHLSPAHDTFGCPVGVAPQAAAVCLAQSPARVVSDEPVETRCAEEGVDATCPAGYDLVKKETCEERTIVIYWTCCWGYRMQNALHVWLVKYCMTCQRKERRYREQAICHRQCEYQDGTCQSCARGYYLTNVRLCEACPTGFYCQNNEKHRLPGGGYYLLVDASCVQCLPGTYCDAVTGSADTNGYPRACGGAAFYCPDGYEQKPVSPGHYSTPEEQNPRYRTGQAPCPALGGYACEGGRRVLHLRVAEQVAVTMPENRETADNPAWSRTYTFDLTVTGSAGGASVKTRVVLGVANVNEKPSFALPAGHVAGSPLARTVLGASSRKTFVGATLAASDPDDDEINFSLPQGNDLKLFKMSSCSGQLQVNVDRPIEVARAAPSSPCASVSTDGVLRVTAPLDFEGRNTYDLIIVMQDQRSDGLGSTVEHELEVLAFDNQNASAATTVWILVRDANEAPIVTAGQTLAVNETASVGNEVGKVLATDEDARSIVTLSLDACNDSTGAAKTVGSRGPSNTLCPFRINVYTGSLSLATALNYEQSGGNRYTLTDVGQSLTYTVVAGNIGEVFDITSQTGQLTVRLPALLDFEGPLKSELSDSGIGSVVTVDASTGQLSLVRSPDYEAVRALNDDASYRISVRATDAVEGALFDDAIVTVRIIDANEAPVVVADSLSLTVPENSGALTSIGSALRAADPDTYQAQHLYFNITAIRVQGSAAWSDCGGCGKFSIDACSGQISVGSLGALDHETEASYELDVTIADSGQPTQVTTAVATVLISDLNELPFVSDVAMTVGELQPVRTAVGSPLGGSDEDAGHGAALRYSLRADGNVGGAFTVGASTGQLSLAAPLDFEALVTLVLH
eukprot:g572.t1